MAERSPAFYRDLMLREGILRKSREIFGSGEISKEAIDDFFLLEGERLKPEERRDLELFRDHAAKRLVNAALNRPGVGAGNRTEAMQHLFESQEQFGLISFHDPAHVITAYDRSDGRDLTPSFLKVTPEEGYTNPEVIKDEFPALVWARIFGGRPLFVSLLNPVSAKDLFETFKSGDYERPEEMQKDLDQLFKELNPKDFESVRRTYERIIILYLQQTAFCREGDGKGLTDGLEEAFQSSQLDPDPKYLQLLQNVFNQYPKDKKTLFKEFQRICAPLLDRLRRKDEQK
jgi:hypothetical protein